ncbi:MAG: ERAP1-like C-terminal domain-containing protein, partial [Terriglobales bacterium]
ESINVFFATTSFPDTRELGYDFVKQNWDALIAKLPTDFGAFLPYAAVGFCDGQHRSDAEAFFKDRATKVVGAPRILAQVLESISLCAANKEANEPSVVEFLTKY